MSIRLRHNRWKGEFHIDIETDDLSVSARLDSNDADDLLMGLTTDLTEGACERLQKALVKRINQLKGVA